MKKKNKIPTWGTWQTLSLDKKIELIIEHRAGVLDEITEGEKALRRFIAQDFDNGCSLINQYATELKTCWSETNAPLFAAQVAAALREVLPCMERLFAQNVPHPVTVLLSRIQKAQPGCGQGLADYLADDAVMVGHMRKLYGAPFSLNSTISNGLGYLLRATMIVAATVLEKEPQGNLYNLPD